MTGNLIVEMFAVQRKSLSLFSLTDCKDHQESDYLFPSEKICDNYWEAKMEVAKQEQ
jgi:hypothetical protein